MFGSSIEEDDQRLTVSCNARVVNIKYFPPDQLPMTVVCTKRAVPDPCNPDYLINAHNVHFRRNRTAHIQCRPGLTMQACALSVIAPDFSWLDMNLPDDSGKSNLINLIYPNLITLIANLAIKYVSV